MHFSGYVLVLVSCACLCLHGYVYLLEFDSVMHSAKLLLVEKKVQYGSVMYSVEFILVGKSSVIKTAC